MKPSVSQPGIILSGAVHVTALGLLLFAFSEARPLPDVHEAVPVETISSSEFQEVMRGEKEVKTIVADAPPKADKVAPTIDSKPETQKPVAQKDVAAPPPPAPPDPAPVEPPPPPPPEPPERPPVAETPPPPVPLPPPAPEPAPVPMPPQRAVADAEVIAPTPPPKPQPPKPQPPKAQPPKVVEQKPPPPRPEPKPPLKPRPEKPRLDQVARLLDQMPDDQPARHAVAHVKPAPEQAEPRQFDPTDISRLLNKEAPAQSPSTGRQISHTRVAGSTTGASQKMAASLWDQLDGLLEDQYKQCWSYLGLDGGSKYIPQIKVLFGEDGALVGEPVLINRPSDPSMQSLADSAMRAVRRCNPMKIPAQYAPYYDQWRGRVLRFDPADMAG